MRAALFHPVRVENPLPVKLPNYNRNHFTVESKIDAIRAGLASSATTAKPYLTIAAEQNLLGKNLLFLFTHQLSIYPQMKESL